MNKRFPQYLSQDPSPQEPDLNPVVEIVRGYHHLCSQAVRHGGGCTSQVERRNEASQINAMLQACISLHIAMLPAEPGACGPVDRITLPDID